MSVEHQQSPNTPTEQWPPKWARDSVADLTPEELREEVPGLLDMGPERAAGLTGDGVGLTLSHLNWGPTRASERDPNGYLGPDGVERNAKRDAALGALVAHWAKLWGVLPKEGKEA